MKRNLVYIGNHLQNSGKNPTYSLRLIGRLRHAGYGVVAASSKANKIWRYLDMLKTLYRNRKSCDYVLIDTYSTWNFYYAISLAWFARRFGLKYIPILHGGRLPQRLKHNPKMTKRYCRGAYSVISPSKYLAESFKNEGVKNIKIIPNALDLSRFVKHGTKSDIKKMIWLRAFIPLYNPQMAIRAFKKVKERFPEASLTMAGPGEASTLSACKRLAGELKVEVNFMGKIDQQQWIELAREHSIFLNTSRADNEPLSVLEALSMGLVVVSTNVGGMSWLINDKEDGLLVPADDHEAMAIAIQKILTDSALQEAYAQKAAIKVEQHDWSKVIGQWESVLI